MGRITLVIAAVILGGGFVVRRLARSASCRKAGAMCVCRWYDHPVPLSDLRGQERAIAFLQRVLTGKRVHHAFLFVRPAAEAQTVRDIATAFAQALTCRVSAAGCGQCADCERVAKNLHPDVLRLARDPASAGREIRVEPLRDLCAALQLAATTGRYKVAIVEDADLLNPSAQNALLRTLEEPPPRTLLILCTAAEDRLLPTIRSRCLRVPFGIGEVQAAGEDSERRRALWQDLGELVRRRGTAQAVIGAIAFAERFGEDRERALEAAGEVAFWLRDLLRFLATGEAGDGLLVKSAEPGGLNDLRARIQPADVLDGFDAVEDVSLALQTNGSARLQLESLALRLGDAA
jgi:DNA polymerase-3 subunit delta'